MKPIEDQYNAGIEAGHDVLITALERSNLNENNCGEGFGLSREITRIIVSDVVQAYMQAGAK